MRQITATIRLTLDGVVQAPGRPDEDRRCGFEHGGWAPPYNPFTTVLDNSLKYVASRTLREPLPWQNSVLLSGDAAETVARLFGDDARRAALRLDASVTTTTGVVVATYRPERSEPTEAR